MDLEALARELEEMHGQVDEQVRLARGFRGHSVSRLWVLRRDAHLAE